MIDTWEPSIEILYNCPPECSSCFFPNNCSACAQGYKLQNGRCLRTSQCVQNRFAYKDICEEYCHERCRSCNQSRTDCIECSDAYTMDEYGQCIPENGAYSLTQRAMFFVGFMRRRGLKAMLLALDDLWFYNFHRVHYDGTALTIFETIQLIEEKRWELVGLEGAKERVETAIEDVSLYNPFSNRKYMEEERKNNLLIASTMDYFCFHLPALLLFVFLCNRLFYCLFHYKVSFLFRPYSFKWILLELLVQNNVELFTFLAFRNLLTPFSFNLPTKMLQVLAILVFFVTIFATFCSYSLYYSEYGKLAKYFLCNMFRFPSSYVLMTLLHGVRPFLKATVHALMYDHWEAQMWLLFSIELVIWLTTLGFEFGFDNHRSKPVFMMDVTYYGCLMILNLLFLCKYQYFKKEEEIVILL